MTPPPIFSPLIDICRQLPRIIKLLRVRDADPGSGTTENQTTDFRSVRSLPLWATWGTQALISERRLWSTGPQCFPCRDFICGGPPYQIGPPQIQWIPSKLIKHKSIDCISATQHLCRSAATINNPRGCGNLCNILYIILSCLSSSGWPVTAVWPSCSCPQRARQSESPSTWCPVR